MDLKIEYRKIDDLIPYKNNPRDNAPAVDMVAESIKEFGFKNPIIIDKDNVIVAGHTRLLAAKKLNIEEVPTIKAEDLTEAQVKAFRIADNKTAEEAEWDFPKLLDELKELEAMDYDGVTGFDIGDIEKMFDDKEVVEDGFDEEPPINPISKLGDIWTLGRHRLMCGDSTGDDVDLLMDGKKANMIHTDPPYGVAYTGNSNPNTQNEKNSGVAMEIKGDKLKGQELTILFKTSMVKASQNSTNDAAFYIWYATSKFSEILEGIKQSGLDIRSFIFWYKVNSPMSAFMSQYIPNYEPLLYCYKHGKSPKWYGANNEKCIWEQQVELKNRIHPTQKPVELPARAIKNSSQENGIVMDLFGGSGSTLIACEQLNRNCYMMELDEKYVDVIVNRYIKFKGTDEDVMLERDGKQTQYKEVTKWQVADQRKK